MKRKVFLLRYLFLVVCLLMVCSMKGQPQAGTFSLTPKVGVNLPNTTNHQYWGELCGVIEVSKSSQRTDIKPGLTVGLDADYMFTKKIGGSFGLAYSNEGFKLDKKYGYITQTLNYLDLSALAEFYVLDGFALKSGIQYGILLKANAGIDHGHRYIPENDLSDNKSYYHNNNISIPIAASYEYKNVILELRYNIGLSNISRYTDDYRTRSLWLTLGYKFEL